MHDPECYKLAKYFIEDSEGSAYSPEQVTDLANAIQKAIEDWIEENH